jgi:hypothetical protein
MWHTILLPGVKLTNAVAGLTNALRNTSREHTEAHKAPDVNFLVIRLNHQSALRFLQSCRLQSLQQRNHTTAVLAAPSLTVYLHLEVLQVQSVLYRWQLADRRAKHHGQVQQTKRAAIMADVRKFFLFVSVPSKQNSRLVAIYVRS